MATQMLTYVLIHIECLDVLEREFPTFTVFHQQLVSADGRAACTAIKHSTDNVQLSKKNSNKQSSTLCPEKSNPLCTFL